MGSWAPGLVCFFPADERFFFREERLFAIVLAEMMYETACERSNKYDPRGCCFEPLSVLSDVGRRYCRSGTKVLALLLVRKFLCGSDPRRQECSFCRACGFEAQR
jgi:hypothetical protein